MASLTSLYIAGGLSILGVMMIASCVIYVIRWVYRHKKSKGW